MFPAAVWDMVLVAVIANGGGEACDGVDDMTVGSVAYKSFGQRYGLFGESFVNLP